MDRLPLWLGCLVSATVYNTANTCPLATSERTDSNSGQFKQYALK